MVTRLSLPDGCDFSDKYVGEAVTRQICQGPRDILKLYIPALMSGIPKQSPTIKTIPIGDMSGMINSQETRPVVKSHVKSCNFLEVMMENNSNRNENWERYGYSNHHSYGAYKPYVKEGSKFQMSFVQGQLSRPVFNTDNTL